LFGGDFPAVNRVGERALVESIALQRKRGAFLRRDDVLNLGNGGHGFFQVHQRPDVRVDCSVVVSF
jgi:hypothetical protein